MTKPVADWLSQPAGGGAQVFTVANEAAQWGAWLNGRKPVMAAATADVNTEYTGGGYDTQNFNVQTEMIAAATQSGGNPYEGVVSVSPDPYLRSIDDRYQELVDFVRDEFDPDKALLEAIGEAAKRIDAMTLSSRSISDSVKADRETSDIALALNVSRMAASLMDQRAIFNTQFEAAIAVESLMHEATIRSFEMKLRLSYADQRNQLVMTLANQIVSLQSVELQSKQQMTQMAFDRAKFHLLAKNDHVTMNLQFASRKKLWNLELFPYGAAMLGAIRGVATSPRGQSNGERLLAFFGGGMSSLINTATAVGGG